MENRFAVASSWWATTKLSTSSLVAVRWKISPPVMVEKPICRALRMISRMGRPALACPATAS